jgi:hypothetical protein
MTAISGSPQLVGKIGEESNAQGPVEKVTVPALGTDSVDGGKNKLKDMTKCRCWEKEKEDFEQKWKMFNCGAVWLQMAHQVSVNLCSLFGLCTVCIIFFLSLHRMWPTCPF